MVTVEAVEGWPVRPDPARVRHGEVQAIRWWVGLAGVAGLVWLWRAYPNLAFVAVVGFVMQVGWNRRRVRVDDRYLWAGWSGLRVADVVGTQVVAGGELFRRAGAAKHHIAAPGPSADKARGWIRRGLVVSARTPEGVAFEWVLSSRDPQRLEAAVVEAAREDSHERDPALLADPDDPQAPPQPTAALLRLAAGVAGGQYRERVRTPWWVWASLPGGFATIVAVYMLVGTAAGNPNPINATGWAIVGVWTGLVAWAVVAADRRVVRVDGGWLRAGRMAVDLSRLRSARVVARPETLNLRQRVGHHSPCPHAVRCALWAHHALLISVRPPDDQVRPRRHRRPPGALTASQSRGRECLYLVGTDRPEALLAAVAAAAGDRR